jgi:carbamoyltransferase
MITWGISGNSHDASLAVFSNTGVEFASHSERFSGQKNDPHLNKELVEYARQQYGDPDEIIWYERPFRKTVRQLRAGQGWNYRDNNIKNYLRPYGIVAPIKYVSHHHSHAAAGYFTSPFSDATIICIDSIGENETFTIWEGREQKLKKRFSQGYPNSIGLWYSAMTQRIGLKPNEDEYILMGMAAYGDYNKYYADILNDMFSKMPGRDGLSVKFKHNLHRGCKWWRPELTSEQDMFDIAAATQKIYEVLFERIIRIASAKYKSRNLVLMGGCALNCSANSIAQKYYNNVWIMPNPGDAGSSIGAVLADRKQHIKWTHPYLGYNIEGDYPVEEIISELKTTGIVGVANGRAEFGPRAFGNRSLLADPRGRDIKQRVNDIKQRQQFRPFAPAILAETATEYFDGYASPYMQYTSMCKKPEEFPAIVHADGTSRVQLVMPNTQGTGFRRLLERWYEETGCPMLLNTSLNIKGKPIVNNLTDAEEFAIMYNIKVFTKATDDN